MLIAYPPYPPPVRGNIVFNYQPTTIIADSGKLRIIAEYLPDNTVCVGQEILTREQWLTRCIQALKSGNSVEYTSVPVVYAGIGVA